MPAANGSIRHDLSSAADHAKRASDDLGRAYTHGRDALPDLARQARGLFDDGVDRIRHQGQDAADAAGEQLEQARTYVVERVQERPVTLTLAALGVGVVLGLIFAGGSRR